MVAGIYLVVMPKERRNLTALGRRRRREYDRSLQKLRDLGMPDWAVEYYRRASRIAGLSPHMVVCHVAVVAAGRQMQANLAHEPAAEAEAPPKDSVGAPSDVEPSYESVQTLRSQVTGLWREIERHGALLGAAEGDVAAADLTAEGFALGTVTPLRSDPRARHRTGTRSRRR
jgi:hypothetical protein